MKNYPTDCWKNDHHHLLFDIGYSYALLARTQDLLEEVLDEVPLGHLDATRQLLEQITEFMQKRLQSIDAIYAEGYKIDLPKS